MPSRRDFMKAAGFFAVAPSRLIASPRQASPNETYGGALIGCGGRGPGTYKEMCKDLQVEMRAQCDDPVALLELAGDACNVVIQALDRDRPPSHFRRLATDDPHSRPLSGIEEGADGYLRAGLRGI